MLMLKAILYTMEEKMQYFLSTKAIAVEYSPEDFNLNVKTKNSDIIWSWASTGKLRLSDGTELDMADASCESFAYKNGTLDGVRAHYCGFCGADGIRRSFSVA